jgi:hypothetical protein
MPGCMLISNGSRVDAPGRLSGARESIDMARRLAVRECSEERLYSAVSFVPNCRLGEDRFFDNGRACGWYCGFLADHAAVPWRDVVAALDSGKYGFFRELKSHFALCVHFRDTGETCMVSDRCSQQPLFYHVGSDQLTCSTTLATFFRCLGRREFEEKWLSDFIFFNFPVGNTTPIRNVLRMPAASVLRMNSGGGKPVMEGYAPTYAADVPFCPEQEMKERTYEVFAQRISKYYNSLSKGRYAASVTSGFDSRVAISFKPKDVELDLYTYGIAGCPDMHEGAQIAAALGLAHHALEIDTNVLGGLYGLAGKSLQYSGGTINALRSTLAFAYERLAGCDLQSVITGISADHFFRSSGATPHTFSVAAIGMVKDPSYRPLDSEYLDLFRNRDTTLGHFEASAHHLESALSWSSRRLSDRQLTFAHYELATKYFGGELALADNYVAMASPYWDSDIRLLSYHSNLSTLTLTPFIHDEFPYWKRHSLFGHVLDRHDVFRSLPVHGLLPAHYAPGSKIPYLCHKVRRLGTGKIARMLGLPSRPEVPLEDWKYWVRDHLLEDFCRNIETLKIYEYMPADRVKAVLQRERLQASDHYLVGKIVTAEMVLSLFDGPTVQP